MSSKSQNRRIFSISKPTPSQVTAREDRPLGRDAKSVHPSHRFTPSDASHQTPFRLRESSQSFGRGMFRWSSSKSHAGGDSRHNASMKITTYVCKCLNTAGDHPCGYLGNSHRNDSSITPPEDILDPATHLPHWRYESQAASAMSLPLMNVPERKSSATALRVPSRQSSSHHLPSNLFVPSRGPSCSPVRRSFEKGAVSSDTLRKNSPPETIVRTIAPHEVLDRPSCRHNQVTLTSDVSAPLFSGGGTLEGKVQLKIAEGPFQKAPKEIDLSISRLCIDVVGVEETSDGKRWVFLSLACELIDKDHPPPFSLVVTQSPVVEGDLSWPLKPSSTNIPFCLNLPLNLGPPPYVSKQARIRYVLAITAQLHSGGTPSIVRQSRDVQLLTVYDPEKALASLPSPLLASDSVAGKSGQRLHAVKLTGGLHRQTWVNGSQIFVDVHVVNQNSKAIKRIEVQLEKTTLWYPYTAAGTAEKTASHLRLPKRTDTEIVAATALKKGNSWKGVSAGSSEMRTLALEVPRGHVTITTGRYFEVRFFLNVIVVVSRFKSLIVQLPVTLIHLNSLDIVPNSLAQVAAAIEAKRARCVPIADELSQYPPYHQGQAFTAPRRQSLDQMRHGNDVHDLEDALDPREIGALTNEVENSLRKSAFQSKENAYNSYQNKNASRATQRPPEADEKSQCDENLIPHPSKPPPSCPDRSTHSSPSMHRHRRNKSSGSLMAAAHPKIPRLQLSTSGLGFTESEFSFEKESPPRKVMLSESERHTLHQQREIRLARQRNIQAQTRERAESAAMARSSMQQPVDVRRRPSKARSDRHGQEPSLRFTVPPGGPREWRNVAVSGARPVSTGPWYGYDGPGAMMPERHRKAAPDWDAPMNLAYGHGQSLDRRSRRARGAYAKHPKVKASFERW
ncbi:MAG: hypothetical protein Q9160_005898 [Pyrenula sp. 1 TL-2023]